MRDRKVSWVKMVVAVVTVFCASASAQWDSTGGNAVLEDTTKKVAIGTDSLRALLTVAGEGSDYENGIAQFINSGLTHDENNNFLVVGKAAWYGQSALFGYRYDSTYGNEGAFVGVWGDSPNGTCLFVRKGGNVGINTVDPGSKLQVYGGVAIGFSASQVAPDGGLVINGNVCIGTTTLGEKLEVSGNVKGDTVKCFAVKINNWTIKAPDYVFEKDYKLPSLKEVEKHITAKKHLPDVPSAAEMKKNGLDLAVMNMTLLKKVEELTLYAIVQNKMIENQSRRIEALERNASVKK